MLDSKVKMWRTRRTQRRTQQQNKNNNNNDDNNDNDNDNDNDNVFFLKNAFSFLNFGLLVLVHKLHYTNAF